MRDLASALDLFTPTAREAADRSALQERLTTKFLASAATLPEFITGLAESYTLLYAGDQPVATYRTLHFDTEQMEFFHAHRRGYRLREKARIRHYDDRRLSYFEIKQRISDGRTVKLRRARPFGDDVLHADDLALLHHSTGMRGEILPQVWTLFNRLTLVHTVDDERATVDFNLRFRDDRQVIDLPDAVIIEVKQPRLNRRSAVMVALQRQRIRSREFSKYCAALVALRPGIRHGRLRPRLRALERIMHG